MDHPAGFNSGRIELSRATPFMVGNATVDPVAHEARYGQSVERLQPQPLKVLIALADARGSVVTREELVARCWEGRYVGDDVINRSILLLRRFADHAGGFIIETVPKSGYRLVERGTAPYWTVRRVGSVLAALATLGLLFGYVARDTAYADPPPPRIAMLPFEGSGDATARLLAAASGDTISHMLLDSGSSVELDWPATPRDVAQAEYVLTGDVHTGDNGYVAFAHMRDRTTGVVIFSRRFVATASDADALPERVGAALASNISGGLARMLLDRRQSGDAALRADLLAQYAHTVEGKDPLQAYQVATRNAEEWPDVLMTQVSLAFDTAFALASLPPDQRPLALKKARRAAEWSLKTGPNFGDTAVPWCLLHPAVWLVECEDRMRAGLRRDPDAPFVPGFLSALLSAVGRFEEAQVLADAGRAANRYNPHQIRRQLVGHYVAGRTGQGDALFAQAIRWWPRHPNLYWSRFAGFLMAGKLDRAERAIAESSADALQIDRAKAAAVFAAVRQREREPLRRTCLSVGDDAGLQMLCFAALGALGDRDTAFDLANKVYPAMVAPTAAEEERRWIARPWDRPDPLLSAPATRYLRDDPRYLALVERVGLGRYWRSGRLPDFCTRDQEPVCRRWARP